MSETRKAFLARVDGNSTAHEQALFIAIEHLQYIAEGAGQPRRLASQCLESIDARLGA